MECKFDFDSIPNYICGDFENWGGLGEPNVYADGELCDVDTEPPEAPAEAPAEAWAADPAREAAVGDLDTFAIRRWTRGAGEVVEYWVSPADGDYASEGDFVFAHQRGAWFLAVACVGGHPAVETPRVSWVNSDGSTRGDAPPADAGPDALIAIMAERGRAYVREQAR